MPKLRLKIVSVTKAAIGVEVVVTYYATDQYERLWFCQRTSKEDPDKWELVDPLPEPPEDDKVALDVALGIR